MGADDRTTAAPQGDLCWEVFGVADAELLSRTFVELADTLVDASDPLAPLRLLSARSIALFGSAEAGVMLSNRHGELEVLVSCSDRMRRLEQFELETDEGPCLEAHRRGERVAAACLDEARTRWPRFAPAARAAGFGAVLAFPLRVRLERIGALNVFLMESMEPAPSDLAAAQALADVATVGILRERSARAAHALSEVLRTTLSAQAVIDQAVIEADGTEATSGGTPGALGQLTRQERRVALAVAGGATNREAAAALLISSRTVEAHLSHIYQKLGVRSRSQLALRLVAAGQPLADP